MDQAPSQYRNKSNTSNEKLFWCLTWMGPCDAFTGWVKQGMTNLIRTGTVIVNSVKTFYETAKEHLQTERTNDKGCIHFKQTFECIDKLAQRLNTT